MVVRKLSLATILCTLALGAAPALGQGRADHLLISEVGYDTLNEANQESSEYVEIFNPTPQAIDLSNVYLSDAAHDYFKLADPNHNFVAPAPRPLIGIDSNDWAYQFPTGSTIPPGGTVVVTQNGNTFLQEFFLVGAGATVAQRYDAFLRTGAQLFQVQDNGASHPVPRMIKRYATTANTTTIMNMANSGEMVVLFFWDGFSDLVEDLDCVTWIRSAALDSHPGGGLMNKTPATPTGVNSSYVEDRRTVNGVARSPGPAPSGNFNFAAPNVSTNGGSIHRNTAVEIAEIQASGNGFTGHDESTEDFSQTFQVGAYTPGVPHAGLGAPQITLPAVVDLGTVPFGQSLTGKLRIENPGSAVLSVTSFNVSGFGLAHWAVDQSGAPYVAPAGSFVEVDVTFTASASAPGRQEVSVQVVSNAGGTPSVTLSASAAEPPTLQVTSAQLSGSTFQLPTAVVGSQPTSASITITNGGQGGTVADLRITGFIFSNPVFSMDNAAPASIPVGQPLVRSIRFSATSGGTFTGTLTLTSNDPQQPVRVFNVTGNALDFGRGGSGSRSGGGGGCAIGDEGAPVDGSAALVLLLLGGLVWLRRRGAASI